MRFWGADSDRDWEEHIHMHDEPTPHGQGFCDCHCERCGADLELDPIFGKFYASCGDCYGGSEPDGEAFRGGEAAAYEREQMAEARKVK